MARMRIWLRLRIALIVTLAAGCDNVSWGGVDVAVVPPPAKSAATRTATDTSAAGLPTAPVLYYVHRAGVRGLMVPVAEISADSLRSIRTDTDWRRFDQRYIATRLRRGGEFTLFRRGQRVGTLVLQRAVPADSELCPRLPVADGLLELVPDADTMTEFLAMARGQAVQASGAGVAAQPDRAMALAGPILAERLLRARKAPLPGDWRSAMKQVFPFPVRGAAKVGFAGSLVVGGTLGVGPDKTGSSLFFIALHDPATGYDTAYTRYADFAHGGKLATRVIDFLDWNHDGQVELLTEGYGSSHTWFGAMGDVAGRWRPIYDGRCATGSAIPAALPAQPGDTAGSPARR